MGTGLEGVCSLARQSEQTKKLVYRNFGDKHNWYSSDNISEIFSKKIKS